MVGTIEIFNVLKPLLKQPLKVLLESKEPFGTTETVVIIKTIIGNIETAVGTYGTIETVVEIIETIYRTIETIVGINGIKGIIDDLLEAIEKLL